MDGAAVADSMIRRRIPSFARSFSITDLPSLPQSAGPAPVHFRLSPGRSGAGRVVGSQTAGPWSLTGRAGGDASPARSSTSPLPLAAVRGDAGTEGAISPPTQIGGGLHEPPRRVHQSRR